MPTLNSHLAASGRELKFPAGPMTAPSPGPTLATAVVAPERLVMVDVVLNETRVSD
nr:hypothetical protein [Salinisphaera sp. G21_0]